MLVRNCRRRSRTSSSSSSSSSHLLFSSINNTRRKAMPHLLLLLTMVFLSATACSAFVSKCSSRYAASNPIFFNNQQTSFLDFAPSSAVAVSSPPALQAVSKRQVAVLDGAELASIESFLAVERGDDPADIPPRSGVPRLGYMSIVAGTVESGSSGNRRVVGVEITGDFEESESVSLGGGVNLYAQSVANIPTGVSDEDAVSTMIASIAGVHCALPRTESVGGAKEEEEEGDNNSFAGGRVVVLGGGEYAVFAADALSALGAEVCLVSTGKPKPKSGNVKVMGPAVGDDEIGFAESIGTFDCLVDTLAEEPPSITAELQRQHKCDRYVSTFSESQKIIREKGIIFGRDTAKKYVVDAATKSVTSGRSSNIIPPMGFGPRTVQTLLDSQVLFKPSGGGSKSKDVFVREWNLKDFWEYTSWPRDSEGNGDTRYGLPVLDTDDIDLVYAMSQAEDEAMYEDDEESLPTLRARAGTGAANPWVVEVKGVEGLNNQIVGPAKHAVLFCSATWCRTCKSLKPKFTKLARDASSSMDESDESDEEDLTYAEADTTGTNGKLLSRYLDVEAVPAFVLFRSGEIYGEPLSISRLPSKKLDLAVEMLVSGKEFDSKAIEAAEMPKN